MMTSAARQSLVILYGIGGLSDVGRHAILAALEQPNVEKLTVITEYPELLDESNWECGCEGGHTNPMTGPNGDKITMVPIDSWKTEQANLKDHFQGANAVISCLGHRQPGFKNKELTRRGVIAYDGNKQVIQAMKEANVQRAVVMSSMGVEEDWPPVEFHFAGPIMKAMFYTVCRTPFKDLTQMERAYKQESLDYLFVRPTGLAEETVPCGKWWLQEKEQKHTDVIVGMDLAKMDCARFMVQEALNPVRHRTAVVIGSEPPTDDSATTQTEPTK